MPGKYHEDSYKGGHHTNIRRPPICQFDQGSNQSNQAIAYIYVMDAMKMFVFGGCEGEEGEVRFIIF